MEVMFIVSMIIYFIGSTLHQSEGIVTKQELKDLALKVVKVKLIGHDSLIQEAEALINSPPSNESEFKEQFNDLLFNKMNGGIVNDSEWSFVYSAILPLNKNFNRPELEESIIGYIKIFLQHPELDNGGRWLQGYMEALTTKSPDEMKAALQLLDESLGRNLFGGVANPVLDLVKAESKRAVERLPKKTRCRTTFSAIVDKGTTQQPPISTTPPPILPFKFKPTDVAKNVLEACRKYSGDAQANVTKSDDRNEYCSALGCKQRNGTIKRAINQTPDGAVCGPLKKCKAGKCIVCGA